MPDFPLSKFEALTSPPPLFFKFMAKTTERTCWIALFKEMRTEGEDEALRDWKFIPLRDSAPFPPSISAVALLPTPHKI